jgi:Tol biopolymer transport system component
VAASRIVFAANRVSLWYGEVYKVDRDGRRIDLSNSPAPDLAPAVSPDGKRVAFVSARGGSVAVYLVGTDRSGLRRLSPVLFSPGQGEGVDAEIAWSPNSRTFLAGVGGAQSSDVYLGDLGGGWRLVGRNYQSNQGALAWSPDGRFASYTAQDGRIQVVSATGKHLWNVAGYGSAWSRSDRLAVAASSGGTGNLDTIRVYDSRGCARSGFPGDGYYAWAPGRDVLASTIGKHLQLRLGGIGKPFLDVRIPSGSGTTVTDVGWIDATRLRVDTANGWVGYDVARKRIWKLPLATIYASVVAADGEVAADRFRKNGTQSLILAGPGSTPARVVQTAPACGDALSFTSMQFVPRQRALIYQSDCGAPSSDLYAVNPDGSGVTRLTDTLTDETQPSLSPDGSSVVYVQQQFAASCQGCPQTLWRIPSSGGTPRQLTRHTGNDKAPFDDSPTWSPDGKTIAFLNSGAEGPITFSEIAAAGGSAHSLGLNKERVGSPAWGPKLIAFAAGEVLIRTYDPTSRTVRTVLNERSGAGDKSLGALAWSADGRLAYVEYDADGRASIFVVGSKKPPINLAPLLPRSSLVSGLAWSPDGMRFAFVATDANGVGEVYTIATDGSGLSRVTNSIGAVGTLSWR